MHSKISASAWLMWTGITVAQILVLSRARRASRDLFAYLLTLIAASTIGMIVAVAGSAKLYFHTFVVAGCITDAVSLYFLVGLMQEFRSRARRKWRSLWLVAVPMCACLALTLKGSNLPFSELKASPWMFVYSSTHIIWTWMAILCALLPVYCFLTGADADRRLTLLSCGLALHIFVQAGVADYLISHNFARAQIVHQISNWAYFISLGLWFAATFKNARRLAGQSAGTPPEAQS